MKNLVSVGCACVILLTNYPSCCVVCHTLQILLMEKLFLSMVTGKVLVVRSYDNKDNLVNWVNSQRSEYNQFSMSKECINMLNSIRFDWTETKSNSWLSNINQSMDIVTWNVMTLVKVSLNGRENNVLTLNIQKCWKNVSKCPIPLVSTGPNWRHGMTTFKNLSNTNYSIEIVIFQWNWCIKVLFIVLKLINLGVR